ncbi:DNA internalization-related competence protein ComEC/Rec2 [Cohnella yongneupensis]|uniref:DNA internalization-related competence protein ComEC/Rec2 n=1 Tax=Cohnella yongneupensis TaxID=425006 RepID=A0ABW0R4G2_9BACL
MNKRPLVVIAICFIVGVAIPSLWSGNSGLYVVIGLSLVLIAIGLSGRARGIIALLCVTAMLIGAGERWWAERSNVTKIIVPGDLSEAEATLSGVITSPVEVDGDLAQFKLRTATVSLASSAKPSSIAETIVVRVKLAKQEEQLEASDWQRGDHIQVKGVLTHPGDAGNFGAFDYRAYLKKRGVFWVLNAKGIEAAEKIKGVTPLKLKPLRTLDQFRAKVGRLMDRLYPHGDAGYMKGLVAGIASDFDPQQYDAFARLGLTHILAISGLHVGVVVFLLLQLGAWARLTRERAIDFTIAMMPVYMLATGASPSAIRACLMAMLALWLARRHQLKDGLHLLAAAALLMLLWNPRLIEEVSFQLSFIVTAGLLMFVPIVTGSLPFRWAWLRGSLAVALTAQAVSFPVTVYYFHAVHLLSLLANFVLVPFVSFIVMPLGMASVALAACWMPLGKLPAMLATIGNQMTFRIVDYLASFDQLRTVWPQPSLTWVVTGFMGMAGISAALHWRLARRKERAWWDEQYFHAIDQAEQANVTQPIEQHKPYVRDQRKIKVVLSLGLAILSLLWVVWGLRPGWTDQTAKVMFLDVGQGDSILIRSGGGKHVLIDTGGTVTFRKKSDEWRERQDPYEIGRKMLVPLLLQRGIRQLDALVLTHLDADHIGGAKAVIANIPVRAILFNGTLKDSEDVRALFELALSKHIPCYEVSAPMTWEVDESLTFAALSPQSEQRLKSTVPIENDQNERSVVLLATLYGRTFLLPGDLEAEGEREIVATTTLTASASPSAPPAIDVLKAGHHGSKTSTTQEWLDLWHPIDTVISVGRNNLYGHPHATVVERLEAAGTHVFRTDEDGEVQYRIYPDGSMERRTKRQG